jgi:diguanylate cyclase (GGDEF)-like protein/PAS domain S-box-containing protein
VDRVTRRFSVPDGLLAAGVVGGAIVLAALTIGLAAGEPVVVVVALAGLILVASSGTVLVRRLRSAARQVEEAGSRLKVLVEHVPAAVYIDMADPDVSDGGRLAYMSPQVSAILGYRPEELVDDSELWPSRIHPDDRAAAIAAYADHWRTGEPLRAEYRMLAKDGSEVWVRDEAYAMADDPSGRRVSQGLLIDTTDRKVLESKLIHDALHDPLTGLANRALFYDRVSHALDLSQREGRTVTVLFLDLDGFKQINDTMGHGEGDHLLRMVANRLRACARATDTVARLGGDEFAVLVEDTAVARSTERLIDRIREQMAFPFTLAGREVRISASVGSASAIGGEVDEILRHADVAMYAAKRAEKGSHQAYDSMKR